MGRMKGLTTFDLHRLDLAVQPIERAFDPCHFASTYLVGSTQRGEEPRDVDVRTILSDEDFDAYFGGKPMLWSTFCLGMTAWLVQQTGLPIDYQVQRMSEANAEHTGPRNHLSGGDRVFAGAGDATGWTIHDVFRMRRERGDRP